MIIVCRTCGRVVDTEAPLDPLVAEERRCPRCGRSLESQWPRTDAGPRPEAPAAVAPLAAEDPVIDA